MIHFQNISAQKVSWVKSNKKALEKHTDAIKNLYYPETIDELTELIIGFYKDNTTFDIIGYSSNTLFLPSYSIDHLICTTKLDKWTETEDAIICDCGVNVAKLSKEMVKKGIKGFYGLTGLPGTIASGTYGNCGCFGCTICELIDKLTILTEDGSMKAMTVGDLELQYRSTSLKRHEFKGTIIQIILKKNQGIPSEELAKAAKAHFIRKATQPKAANNLGTTFLGREKTTKLWYLLKIAKIVKLSTGMSYINSTKFALSLFGGKKYSKYLFIINRYMFLDEMAHSLFPEYIDFMRTLYKDSHLEIEIKK